MWKDIFHLHYYKIQSKKHQEVKQLLESQVVQKQIQKQLQKQLQKQAKQKQQLVCQHQEMVHQLLRQLKNI